MLITPSKMQDLHNGDFSSGRRSSVIQDLQAALRIRIRIHRIHMFLGLPDPNPLFRGKDPDPDPSIIMQK
jgi:hypothetical protein